MKFLNYIFIVVYSFVNKNDKESAVINVGIHISFTIGMISFIFLMIYYDVNKFPLSKELVNYIVPLCFFLIPNYFFYKYYFYKERFINLIIEFDNLPDNVKFKYKIMSIFVPLSIALFNIFYAQLLFLSKN